MSGRSELIFSLPLAGISWRDGVEPDAVLLFVIDLPTGLSTFEVGERVHCDMLYGETPAAPTVMSCSKGVEATWDGKTLQISGEMIAFKVALDLTSRISDFITEIDLIGFGVFEASVAHYECDENDCEIE